MRFGVHISASFDAEDIDHALAVTALHVLNSIIDDLADLNHLIEMGCGDDGWLGDIDIYPEEQ